MDETISVNVKTIVNATVKCFYQTYYKNTYE